MDSMKQTTHEHPAWRHPERIWDITLSRVEKYNSIIWHRISVKLGEAHPSSLGWCRVDKNTINRRAFLASGLGCWGAAVLADAPAAHLLDLHVHLFGIGEAD